MTKTVFGFNQVDDRFFNGTDMDFQYVYEFDRADFSYLADDADVKFVTRGGDDAVFLFSPGGEKAVDTGGGDDFVRAQYQTGSVVRLGTGNDNYRGEIETDVKVSAGSGNDTFFLAADKSSYFGESGNDSFTVDQYLMGVGRNIFNGGSGADHFRYVVIPETGSPVSINLDKGVGWSYDSRLKDRLVGIENASGSSGNDTLIGSRVGNVLSGGDGNDLLKGLDGNDILYGEGSDAELFDFGSKDRLIGGAGNDTLIGGIDADILEGGSGKDIFRYLAIEESTVEGRDAIKDFRSAQRDRIDLSAIDADTTIRGGQNFSFIGKSAFTGKAGEVNFRHGVLSADVDGDKAADFQVRLIGVVSFAEGDLIL